MKKFYLLAAFTVFSCVASSVESYSATKYGGYSRTKIYSHAAKLHNSHEERLVKNIKRRGGRGNALAARSPII